MLQGTLALALKLWATETQLTTSPFVLPPSQSNKVPVVQHPHHVHPLTPLITYSNEHFTPGNPPPHLPADVDPKTGKLGNSEGLSQEPGPGVMGEMGSMGLGVGDVQIHTWELLVGLAWYMCWAVSPFPLERSTYRDKIYICTFGVGCLGKLALVPS